MSNPFDLHGRIALVTGAARGLGEAIAAGLARAGATVVYNGRDAAALDAARGKLDAALETDTAVFDVTRQHAVKAGIAAIEAKHGSLDIVVNNAGMSPPMASHDVTEALFDSVVGLNFKGPFRLASQVARRMFEGDGGVIINVSSSGALMPLPNVVPYGAAKAALNAMTRSLAAEYGPKVRVNTLSPGPFLTDISRAWTPEQRESAGNACGRPGRPEEVVTAALFLASPASSFVNGSLIRVDGGLPIGQ